MTNVVQQSINAARRGIPIFEDAIQHFYTALLKPGDTVVDGGAHAGRHTYPCADLVGPTGRVHAFEVLPPLVAKMQSNLGKYPQVILHNQALSDRSGERVPFIWVKNAWGHSGLRDRDHGDLDPVKERIEVTTTKIDSLPDDLISGWRFCKLDLEGGEFTALSGGLQKIQRNRPAIIFENARGHSAKDYGYSMEDFFGFFSKLQYDVFDIAGRSFGPEQWPMGGWLWDFIAAPHENAATQDAVCKMPNVLEQLLAA